MRRYARGLDAGMSSSVTLDDVISAGADLTQMLAWARSGRASPFVLRGRSATGEPQGYQCPACAPPSTCSVSPVTNAADSRYSTASTISETSPIRPRGCSPARKACVWGACIGVLMTPGATAFTRMPLSAYSIANDLVTASSPPLVRDASADGAPFTG